MILINITDQNIWVVQPFLATELFKVEVEPQQYHKEFNHEGLILPSHSCWHLHMKDKNKWRIMR